MNKTVLDASSQKRRVKMGGVLFKVAQRYSLCARGLSSLAMSYPAKILLAWGEAISGSANFREYLMKHGFEELGLFCFALRHDARSRNWLMTEGFPHLMATIRGAEGDALAVEWLRRFGYGNLAEVALGADNDDEAIGRLLARGEREWAGLALKIRSVKNQIEDDNADIHKISRN